VSEPVSEPVHPLFIKYKRDWLHKVTGYSVAYLSRVATGKTALSGSFIQRVCLKLNQPEAELFLADCDPVNCDSDEQSKLSQWLAGRCKREHLTLRHAAAKTGLSHTTIHQILNGSGAFPETIKKLAQGFGGDGTARLALEDHLLVLAGYRTQRPEGEELSEPLAHLIDKVKEFNQPQLKVMESVADFLTETKEKRANE